MHDPVTGCTCGEAGKVDWHALAEGCSKTNEWSDPHFGHDDTALWIDPDQPGGGAIGAILDMDLVWQRVSELSEHPMLFYDDPDDDSGHGGAEANDIMQGSLGDCYLLSALSILCTTRESNLVVKLFVCVDLFHKGLVGVRFYKDSKWWHVAVDTWLPCVDGQPVFARNKDPNEFWMSIMEKAYAKLHGSYESCDAGFMNDALVDLTGAAPGSVRIFDLFAACMDVDGTVDEKQALRVLLGRSKGTLLQGASCDDGGSEEPVQGGLYSGHAYSINQVVEVKTLEKPEGEILIQLRNPWGGHEWSGRWCDNDSRWTDELQKEIGQRDVDDGMFWMCVDDFATHFTTITYADLVPEDYSVVRAEGEWTTKTAGGCANHKTWKNNPQILLIVRDKAKIIGTRVGSSGKATVTVCLSQPDSRMLFRNNELGKEDFDELYGNGTGYEESIGFNVWKVDGAPARKTVFSAKGQVASADHSELRGVSDSFECDPGTYLICPCTFDPKPMKWTMMIWCSNPIECVDTNGGEDVQFYDATDADILSEAECSLDPLPQRPMTMGTEAPLPSIRGIDVGATPLIAKGDPGAPKNEFTKTIAKSTWKCGTELPEVWKNLQEYTMNSTNTFEKGEMVGVKRPDHTMRFAKVLKINKDKTYDLCTGYVQDKGPLYKSNVPGFFIAKFPHSLSPPSNSMLPTALMKQVGATFDCLDLDKSGTLDFGMSADGQMTGELSGDLGRRFLYECQIPTDNMAETYEAIKSLDLNGDGDVDRAEFVDWMAKRMIMLSTKPVGSTLAIKKRYMGGEDDE